MYIPESKSIRSIGWAPYRKAAKHWVKAAWHWLVYNVIDLASRVPFVNKEWCFVKEVSELLLATGNLYAVAVLIIDHDTVMQIRDVYNEIKIMWTTICS